VNNPVAREPFAWWRASESTRRMVGVAAGSIIATIMTAHMIKISAV
jgi:hypothetical protein